jgi:hypothetical protein
MRRGRRREHGIINVECEEEDKEQGETKRRFRDSYGHYTS